MAMNFPDSPSINQQFTAGGRTWAWNGSAWNSIDAAQGEVDLSELLLMGA
jgi:hypothetical protein